MSVIRVHVEDQVLRIIEAPTIATGGQNEVKIAFTFCDKWDGYSKTAVFYRDEANPYFSVLNADDVCVMPWEVYYEVGTFYIGVFGDKDGVRRTSAVIKYKVRRGAITGDAMPSDPSPEVYDQIMSAFAEAKAEQDSFIETATKTVQELEDARDRGDFDGFTPTLYWSEDGEWLTIIGKNGTTTQKLKGDKGDSGKDGQDGKSAYQIACDNGFEGTEAEWLDSINGNKVVELLLLEDKTYTGFTESNGVYTKLVSGFNIVAGETYKVIWDGVEYIRTAEFYSEGSTTTFIGNKAQGTGTVDTDEPFYLANHTERLFKNLPMFSTRSTASSHRIAVYHLYKEHHLPRVDNRDNGKALKVVAGQWTATEDEGGSGLPEVSTSDNGKVMQVVDGEWTVAEVSGLKGEDGVSATHSWNGTTLTITSASGTSSADLKGEKGDTGATGPKGDKGDKGDTGTAGANGKDGTNGKDGADGKSAYQIAQEHGFEGTEEEWLESLKGEGGSTITTLMEEQTIDGFAPSESYGGLYTTGRNFPESGHASSLVDSFTLIVGETYIVEWDGVEYECVAQDVSVLAPGAVGLGNGVAFGLSGNNEPFVAGMTAGQGVTFISLTETVTSHTIGIYQGAKQLTKSDVVAIVNQVIEEALGGDY